MSNPTSAVGTFKQFHHIIGDVSICCDIANGIANSYETGMCLNNWSRFLETANEKQRNEVFQSSETIGNFSKLFSFSQTFTNQLIQSLEHLDYLLEESTLNVARLQNDYDIGLERFLNSVSPDTEFHKVLSIFKNREMLRIAMRDMLGASILNINR